MGKNIQKKCFTLLEHENHIIVIIKKECNVW